MTDTDPTPTTPVTIGDRLGWLRGDMNAKLDNLGTKLDTVVDKLSAILAALTSSSGNIDAAPIVAAIQALAGPYPGRTLTDLYAVSNDIKSNIGQPLGDATTTLLGRLYSIQYALTTLDPTNATLLAKIDAIMRSLTLPSSLDYTVLQELDLIRRGQETGLTNLLAAFDPMAVEPPNLCSNAYSSYNMIYTLNLSIEGFGIEPQTIATWAGPAPAGLSIIQHPLGAYGIQATDWSLWKVFVQTTANNFGVKGLAYQRITANTWLTLSGNDELNFYVDGQHDIKVYLCRIGEDSGQTDYYVWSGDEIISYATGAGSRWQPIHTKYANLAFTLAPSHMSYPTYWIGDGTRIFDFWKFRITGGTNRQGLKADTNFDSVIIYNGPEGTYGNNSAYLLAQTYGDKPDMIELIGPTSQFY